MNDTKNQNKLISYRVCRVRCKRCGDILEHINKSKNDNFDGMLVCSCGKVSLDPSAIMYRIIGSPSDYEDLSEKWESSKADYLSKGFDEKSSEYFANGRKR